MNKKLLAKKNILITGINGFIGKNLSDKLSLLGANVWGISRSGGEKRMIKANVIEFAQIDQILKDKKIDICFHLAAESSVESGQNDPYHTFKINTLGTLNILESARKNKLEKVIVASTSHVYGDNPLPYREWYSPKPSRPYETSKACIDLIAQSYAETFSLPVLIPRFSNIYGPGDMNFTRLIPKTIKSLLINKRPEMWGGNAVRDYVYIDDAIDGYLRLATIPISSFEKNRIFNFGTGNRISVRQMIEKIIKISGSSIEIKKVEDGRPFEITKQYVSSAKARKVLGWRPKTSMEIGLEKTYKWYSNYFNLR